MSLRSQFDVGPPVCTMYYVGPLYVLCTMWDPCDTMWDPCMYYVGPLYVLCTMWDPCMIYVLCGTPVCTIYYVGPPVCTMYYVGPLYVICTM